MKNNLLALSIFCLGVFFVVGCWIISNGLNNKVNAPATQTTKSLQITQKQLLTQSDLADYLGLSLKEVLKLGPTPNGPGSFTTEIPYIQIENTIYYSKTAVDKWLLNNEMTIVQ
jgi:hypothetical protein